MISNIFLLFNFYVDSLKRGGRSIRSSQVHTLTDLFPGYIFPDIPAKDFADRKKRPHIPQVADQLRDHRFLYDRDPKTPADRLNGHLRGPCVLKVTVWLWLFLVRRRR